MAILVDWTKPIEAVRVTDGRVVPMVFSRTAHTSLGEGYFTKKAPDPATSNTGWYQDGTDHCSHKMWKIRNVEPVKTDEELAKAYREAEKKAGDLLKQLHDRGYEVVDDDGDLVVEIVHPVRISKDIIQTKEI